MLLSSGHIKDIHENHYVIENSELSTQSLVYFLRYKSGWQITGMDGADGCFNFDQEEFICLVRDEDHPGLKESNYKLHELGEFPIGLCLPRNYTDFASNPIGNMENCKICCLICVMSITKLWS